jgi:hypothetical protein
MRKSKLGGFIIECKTRGPEGEGTLPPKLAHPGSSVLLSQIGDILDIVHQ